MVLIDSPSSSDEEFNSRSKDSGILTEDEQNNDNSSDNLRSPTPLNEASITASTPQRRSQEPYSVRRSEEPSELDRFGSSSDSSDDDSNHGSSDVPSTNGDNTWKTDTIPQVGKNLTPWRREHISASKTDPQFDRYGGSPPKFRDLSIKPQLNPVTFETRPVNFKSVLTSSELDGLKSQMKKYKIKITALEEVIKNINQSDGPNKEDTKLFYEKLLKEINDKTMADDNIADLERLSNENKNLKDDLTTVQEELKSLRIEYNETLTMTDEHFKDVETMNSTLNTMLEDLIEVMKQDHDPNRFEQEIPILQNALNQKSDFVLNKLIHFQNNWIDVIQSPEFQQRNILPIDGPTDDPFERNESNETKDTIENASVLSQLSPQAETIIEQLHKQYDAYMLDVGDKLGKLSKLQDLLMKKLKQQDRILHQLPLFIGNNDNSNKKIDNSKEFDSLNTSISQLSFEFQNKLTSTETEFNKTIRNVITKHERMINEAALQRRASEKEYMSMIRQLTSERDSIKDKFDSLQDDFNQLQQYKIKMDNARDRDFSNFKQSLVFCLTNIINILEPVLEKESIEKSYKKIAFIKNPDNGLDTIRQIQMKVESLLRFSEKALSFLTESYTSFIVSSPLSPLTISPTIKTPLSSTETERDYLRIKELERMLATEKETRSIESQVIEQRINKLEVENQKLRQQLKESKQT